MVSFLNKYGRSGRVQLRPQDIPDSLREGLMTVLAKWFTVTGSTSYLHFKLYEALYRRQPDTLSYDAEDYHSDIADMAEDCGWGEFYAICEAADDAIVPLNFGDDFESIRLAFAGDLNELLEVEAAPWRMKDGEILPTFPEDAGRVLDEASASAQQLTGQGVAVHLEKARRYLTPSHLDEENAVKEAVSAVEAAIKARASVQDFDSKMV